MRQLQEIFRCASSGGAQEILLLQLSARLPCEAAESCHGALQTTTTSSKERLKPMTQNNSELNPILAPIVGMHFRPPAKWMLARLPAGATLILRPEPENPYDSKAIKVFCFPGEIPSSQHSELENEISGTGTTLEELLELDELWIGYVGDSDGKICKKNDWSGNREVGERQVPGWFQAECELSFMPDGAPAVLVQ